MSVEGPQFVVFYSWQSDLPNNITRGFIEDALEKAARNIKADGTITVQPMIDRDTAGVPGSPAITDTILQKLDAADAVVSDVSLIAVTEEGRPTPNPNVLVELGYAVRARGWPQIVMVMNTHFGPVESLPFDLRGHRVIQYSLAPNETNRSATKQDLVARLEHKIRELITLALAKIAEPVVTTTLATLAYEAIEQQRPNRADIVGRFLSEGIERLIERAPNLAKDNVDPDALLAAIASSTEVSVEFGRICALAASMNDAESADALYRGLEPLAEHFYISDGQTGMMWTHQFDFFRYMGLEWVLMLVACLLRNRKWEILAAILDTHFQVSNSTANRGRAHVGLEYFGLGIYTLSRIREHVSGIGFVLHERFSSTPLSEYVAFSEIQAADYFVFLRLELPAEVASEHPEWTAHSLVYSAQAPRFLVDALRHRGMVDLATGLGLRTPDALRNLLTDRGRSFLNNFGPFGFRLGGFRDFDFSRIGLG